MNADLLNKADGLDHSFKNTLPKSPDQFGKMANSIGNKVGSAASTFAHRASDHVKNSREYVSHNPAKGVMIAAAAGVAIGGLMAIAMRRKI